MFRIVEREPGKQTVMKAKARGFQEAGVGNHEMLRENDYQEKAIQFLCVAFCLKPLKTAVLTFLHMSKIFNTLFLTLCSAFQLHMCACTVPNTVSFPSFLQQIFIEYPFCARHRIGH